MAITRLTISGNGQIEPNRCSFLHDGNIEAQCSAKTDLELGMIVAVNKAAKEVKKPAASDVLFGVLYNGERIYDERTPGRKNYKVVSGEGARVGYVKAGDVYSTNCLAFDPTDTTTFASEADVWTALSETAITATPVYGKACASGYVLLSKTSGTYGPKLLAVEATDTADGQKAVKFQVI